MLNFMGEYSGIFGVRLSTPRHAAPLHDIFTWRDGDDTSQIAIAWPCTALLMLAAHLELPRPGVTEDNPPPSRDAAHDTERFVQDWMRVITGKAMTESILRKWSSQSSDLWA